MNRKMQKGFLQGYLLPKATLNQFVIYFTTITKQVIQLILIMLVGTGICVRMVFVCEETGVLGGNPPV